MFYLAARGYRCIAHDRRGHGRSSQPWDGNDMDTYADDLAALVRRVVAGVLGLKNVFTAEVLQHDAERAVSRLKWGGATLAARLNSNCIIGSHVNWFVPPSHIVLHRPEQQRQRDLESDVDGVIVRCVPLRETTNIQLAVSAVPGAMLSFSIPTRIAQSNGLENGLAITVSLLADGVHLMPEDSQEP
jgi:hypothetical protein